MTGLAMSAPSLARNYGGTSPVTKASGRSQVVLARSRQKPPAGHCTRPVGLLLAHSFAGARRYYDGFRAAARPTARPLASWQNRWVGILHCCLDRGQLYSEEIAWKEGSDLAALTPSTLAGDL